VREAVVVAVAVEVARVQRALTTGGEPVAVAVDRRRVAGGGAWRCRGRSRCRRRAGDRRQRGQRLPVRRLLHRAERGDARLAGAGALPSAFIAQISAFGSPGVERRTSSRRPSGDHAGCVSLTALALTRRWSDPSAFMTYTWYAASAAGRRR